MVKMVFATLTDESGGGLVAGLGYPQSVLECPKKGQKAVKKLLTMLVDSVKL
jgi:hypothetical protein